MRVAWVSRLGDHCFGRHIRRTIEQEGVDCSPVEVIGALAVQVVGDMEGLPTRAQLEAAQPH
ncbi:MAG TPA: hypothetical protein VLA73_06915 [Burkholderiales bacterium]|nr:hypothetical protein [Burkholderiales bacterium]